MGVALGAGVSRLSSATAGSRHQTTLSHFMAFVRLITHRSSIHQGMNVSSVHTHVHHRHIHGGVGRRAALSGGQHRARGPSAADDTGHGALSGGQHPGAGPLSRRTTPGAGPSAADSTGRGGPHRRTAPVTSQRFPRARSTSVTNLASSHRL